MDWIYPYPTQNVCPWIPEYQYLLLFIPNSYPNLLSMDIHTLPETHLFLFKIQKHFNLKTLSFLDRQKKKKKPLKTNHKRLRQQRLRHVCILVELDRPAFLNREVGVSDSEMVQIGRDATSVYWIVLAFREPHFE